MTFKLLVCGGRDYADHDTLNRALDALRAKHGVTHIIHGGAAGADALAGLWARTVGVQEVIAPANWTAFGKRAGPVRNQAMIELGVDMVLAAKGGMGTASMCGIARKAGVAVVELGKELSAV